MEWRWDEGNGRVPRSSVLVSNVKRQLPCKELVAKRKILPDLDAQVGNRPPGRPGGCRGPGGEPPDRGGVGTAGLASAAQEGWALSPRSESDLLPTPFPPKNTFLAKSRRQEGDAAREASGEAAPARPGARASSRSRPSTPLRLLLAPWTLGSLLVRSLTRYLRRRTPPPPRRSSSVCHRSCPNALTSPRCRRPRPARKREGSGGAEAHARAGPRALPQGGLDSVPRPVAGLAPRTRVFSLPALRTLGENPFCPRLLSDCWVPTPALALFWPSLLGPGRQRVPAAQASLPWLDRARPGCSLSACILWDYSPSPPKTTIFNWKESPVDVIQLFFSLVTRTHQRFWKLTSTERSGTLSLQGTSVFY
ncbi:uncharacterized protein LOC121141207 [Mesocricetus auratus]|uniref:Uncharacterized protein LOC121141207 n=1 Tax=Mesocricetus auratus TaxID=10036 RepID=A0ABM2XMN1_MESAU|nr:uncharacterized protein LOC121141207 [Mesocricetus auratus]